MSKELADTLPASPVDGYQLIYWSTFGSRLTCVRLVYYANTKWTDHPWSKAYKIDTGGADFEDDWCIESSEEGTSFTSDGRLCGWDIRCRLSEPFAHCTREQAAKYLHAKLTQRLSGLETEVTQLKERLNLLAEIF